MERLQRQTLLLMRDQMASFPWDDAEIAKLASSSLGVISGLPALLIQLEELRQYDLGAIPPACGTLAGD